MRVACVQISSVEQTHIIQLSMYTGSNHSVYHMAWLVECLAREWCLYIFLLKYYTLEIQMYITKEHYLLIFVIFEITRNNKRTVYSFQEKYQLVCSSILSYTLIYHIFLKYINCSNHYSNISFLKNRIKIVFSLM